MNGRWPGMVFAALVIVLHLAFTVPVVVMLPTVSGPGTILLMVACNVVMLGLAVELAELMLSLLPVPVAPCRLAEAPAGVSVAVLYVCCDDVDPASIASLRDPGPFDVFVLDDSRSAESRDLVDRSGLRVIRRGTRTDFKAGNLNHWLRRFGADYDYFVVLDNDSLMSVDAIRDLVAHAEHPANRDVAIVQATNAARPGSRFQRHVGLAARLRSRVLARVHRRLGWTLSQGHNALHRTSAIAGIGGFPTTASCEDTLASLALRAARWRIELVGTLAFEGEPRDPLAYRRRIVRWARQTLDVVLRWRRPVPAGLVLLLSRHLLGYLAPLAGMALLVLTAFSAGRTPGEVFASRFATSPPWITWLYGSPLLGGLGLVLLRAMLVRRTGIGLAEFARSSLLGGALQAFCSLHVGAGLLRSLVAGRVGFDPTGARGTAVAGGGNAVRTMLLPSLAYVALACAVSGAGAGPAARLVSFWAWSLVLAPAVLWGYGPGLADAEGERVGLMRKPRVFVSYCHEDEARLPGLLADLVAAGFDPVIDRTELHHGDPLPAALMRAIDDAAYVVAAGSPALMESWYCELEVGYADERRKPYLPLLLVEMAQSEQRPWFLGHRLGRGRVRNAFRYFDSGQRGKLGAELRHLDRPLSLGGSVALALLLFIVLPLIVGAALRPIVGAASEQVRARQARVEAWSREVDACREGGRQLQARLVAAGSPDIEYRDRSGRLVARDRFGPGRGTQEPRLQVRDYFDEGGRLVASDSILVQSAPNGAVGLQKLRRIFVDGTDVLVIEDRFDSIGRLVQKRVLTRSERRWELFGDLSTSVYPMLVPWVPAYP